MSNKNNTEHKLKVILIQLRSLERVLNNSIDHNQKTNYTYPTVAKKYNLIVDQLKELTQKDPTFEMAVNSLDKFEEEDFQKFGNYKSAVNLQATIRILSSDLLSLRLSKGLGVAQYAVAPIVFISYATEEIALAYFIENVLQRWTNNKIEVFIAKRGLKSSDPPLKIMEEKLKTAYCIIPICSKIAKNNSWVWWESAAVWGSNHKVHPLFTNIYPGEFGPPLTLFVQGKSYFNKDEFIATLATVCQQLRVNAGPAELNEEELVKFNILHEKYAKVGTSEPIKEKNLAKVEISYKKMLITQDLHRYSLIFNVENQSKKKFTDLDLEIFFPIDYLETKEHTSAPLISSIPEDKKGYLTLHFMFSGLTEKLQKKFSNGLLPKNKLRIFGEDGILRLYYLMDHKRWEKRLDFELQWKLYIDGGASQEGSTPLDSIQIF